jgi:TolA-binding protein
MTRAPICIVFCWLASACWTTLFSAELPEIKAANQALKDQLPDVAVAKLERLLSTSKLVGEPLLQVRTKLAEAAVRAGKYTRVLEVAVNVVVADAPELAFWKAAALQALGQWNEALQLYTALPTESTWPLVHEAAFNRTATLMALADYGEARKSLETLAANPNPAIAQQAKLWSAEIFLRQKQFSEASVLLKSLADLPPSAAAERDYLLARVLLEEGKPAEAATLLASFPQQKSRLSRHLHFSAMLTLARAQRLTGEKLAAGGTLAVMIGESPPAPLLTAAFREFRLCLSPPEPELEKLLVAWSAGNVPQTAAEAMVALIATREAAGNLDEALRLCASFSKTHPQSPMLAEIQLNQSRLLITQGRAAEAMPVLQALSATSQPAAVRAYAAEVMAYAKLREGDFAAVAQAFKIVTENTGDSEKKLLAAFRGALASIQTEAADLTLPQLSGLPESRTVELRQELLLEQGLYAASQGMASAEETLQRFLEQAPNHPRAFAAAIALAELALVKVVNSPENVRDKIAFAQRFVRNAPDQEALDVLALQLESQNFSPEIFSTQVDAFFQKYPESAHKAELLMKVAVRLHNAQQYAPAKARFLQLVDDVPESPLVEAAQFWAGKAALGSLAKGCEDEAIKLWDGVAKGKGPLRFAARLEQGKLDQRRDPDAAMQIFDSILKADPPPDLETRFQVLCLRGETMMATAGTQPEPFQAAITGFDLVINAPNASLFWRQQALVRKGACLENLGKPEAALEAYYTAMNLTQSSSTQEMDYHWFFRAGEKALRLLESKSDWRGAVSIAQKMAEAPGPQADVARERASRLITEHYLWEDE